MIPYTHWVLITGCDSGFGLLTAQQLLALGYCVIAISLTEEGCQRLRQTATYPSRLHVIQCDITNSNDLERLQSELNSYQGGKLWAIVNNAGIVIPGYLDYLTVADFRKVMEVNFFGAINITQLCLPFLKESRGRIINISSTCGLVALPGNGPYNASKFALRAFSDTLRRELAVWGIKVVLIIPGVMRTPINEKYLKILQDRFELASQDIRQAYGEVYPQKILLATAARIRKMAQDPRIAVNTIIHAVTSRRPKDLYLPGWDAKLFYHLHKRPPWFGDKFVNLSGRERPAAMHQRGTKIIEYSQLCDMDQAATYSKFLDVLWKQGAGFRPKVILEEHGDATGNGCTRWIPLWGKHGIREAITATDHPHRICYQVTNPSWTTFPVDLHRGWVDFIPVERTATQVVWTIELTPKRGMTGIVMAMIRFIIPRYLNVLAKECQGT